MASQFKYFITYDDDKCDTPITKDDLDTLIEKYPDICGYNLEEKKLYSNKKQLDFKDLIKMINKITGGYILLDVKISGDALLREWGNDIDTKHEEYSFCCYKNPKYIKEKEYWVEFKCDEPFDLDDVSEALKKADIGFDRFEISFEKDDDEKDYEGQVYFTQSEFEYHKFCDIMNENVNDLDFSIICDFINGCHISNKGYLEEFDCRGYASCFH